MPNEKKRGLGRGLDLIFDENTYDDARYASDGVRQLRLSLVDPRPGQPRQRFSGDTLAALADSIAANGVLQPILVRQTGERYEIIAGERRFRGAKMAGLTEIPAIVLDAGDRDAARFALIENLQREDLNPWEEAAAYRRFMEEFSLSQEEAAAQVGKSRSAVANALRLLELPEEVAALVIDGSLSAGHARTLLGLRDRTQLASLAHRVVEKEISVRELESLVKQMNLAAARAAREAEADGDAEKPVQVDYIGALEHRFTEATGRRCRITQTRNRKQFTVEFRDNEDLEALLRMLAGADFLEEI